MVSWRKTKSERRIKSHRHRDSQLCIQEKFHGKQKINNWFKISKLWFKIKNRDLRKNESSCCRILKLSVQEKRQRWQEIKDMDVGNQNYGFRKQIMVKGKKKQKRVQEKEDGEGGIKCHGCRNSKLFIWREEGGWCIQEIKTMGSTKAYE